MRLAGYNLSIKDAAVLVARTVGTAMLGAFNVCFLYPLAVGAIEVSFPGILPEWLLLTASKVFPVTML